LIQKWNRDLNCGKHQRWRRQDHHCREYRYRQGSGRRDVLLVDGDEQRTAITFTELRSAQLGQPGYTAVSLQGAAIRTQVRQLAPKYDDIIIDVGGRDTGSLRAALTITNTFLVPVLPRSFDLWAIDQVAELVNEAREAINPDLRACVFLNAADAQGHDNEDSTLILKDAAGLELLALSVGRRKAFPNAAAAGKAITEQTAKEGRDQKAIQELTDLLEAVYTQKI
jgi:chromosome partitioning protein